MDLDRTDRYARWRPRGESAVAFAAMVLAAVLVLVGLILLVARITAPKRVTDRLAIAARERLVEKVYVGRAGDLGFLLRGAGSGGPGRSKRESEARALALEPGQIVARIDTYNFSNDPMPLVDGPFLVRIGDGELKPLPSKGETDPASPVYAALAGGDTGPVLAPHTARRIGLVGPGSLFDTGESASVRRGRIAEDVILQARAITERELAEFDRQPAPAALDRILAGNRRPEPQR